MQEQQHAAPWGERAWFGRLWGLPCVAEWCGDDTLRYRLATDGDVPLLARLNRELIDDEGHRNPMAVPELAARMRGWLAGEYCAVLFEREGQVVAYVLYRAEASDIYVRHLYVVRGARRQGIATAALRLLAREVWPPDTRISLDVLVDNAGTLAFYRPGVPILCADARD